MKRERVRRIASIFVLAVFALLAAGSMDEGSLSQLWSEMESEMLNGFHPGDVPEGNRVIHQAGHGTTVQKEAREKAAMGRTFRMAGFVSDVLETNKAVIQLDPSNYAQVDFNHSVAHLDKGNYVSFDARIDKFGTGILLRHKLSNARLRQ